MKKICLISTLVLAVLMGKPGFAQDFSNKGKEFWLVFPAHVPSSNLAQMGLFITSDKNSSGTISVNGFNTTFNVVANQITGPIDIPYSFANIPNGESGMVVPKGIQVKVNAGQPPVVVYAHIYAGFRSEASLILPVTVLDRKYYSMNFYQGGNGASQFQVVATQPNTTIQYRLRRNGNLDPNTFTVLLPNPGDVIQIQDQQDLTGSVIESISVGNEPCKKIAVFSGSSNITISSNQCGGASADPLFQQCYSSNTWGKKYGVVPLGNNPSGYHMRVMAQENNTTVNVNGNIVMLNEGEIYPAANNPTPTAYTRPLEITADKPISVAQYMMSGGCTGSQPPNPNGNPLGDPEMILLNPVEQNIKDITIFSSSLQAINRKYLSVYIETTKANTFRINGNPPNAGFLPMPAGSTYSYLIEEISNYPGNFFRLTADTGFNCTAYGMGPAESYGYSAGTNVKDIYQYVTLANQYASVNYPATCKNTPFNFSITFPYQPTEIQWIFGSALNALGYADLTIVGNPVGAPIIATSTSVVNGITLHTYTLPGNFSIPTAGSYPIRVLALNPTPNGCGGIQEREFDIEVFEPPVADFTFTNNGCVTSPVQFTDASDGNGRDINHWYWNFDGTNTSSANNPAHTFTAPGTYNVKYAVRTDVGCISDTAEHEIILSDLPIADFLVTAPQYCVGKPVNFDDISTITGTGSLVKWTWDFGDGSPLVTVMAPNNADQVHTYSTAGTYTVSLIVESGTACASIVFSDDVVIGQTPVAVFNLPNVCLPSGLANFEDLSTVGAGGIIDTWAWDFGDAGTSALQDPTHNYTTTGPFSVSLTVTTNSGCTHTTTQALTTIYEEPQAAFLFPAEVCLGSNASFTDQSSAPGSSVAQWSWDFGDGSPLSNVRNPTHLYAAAGTYTVTLNVTSAIGCQTVTKFATQTVVVNPLPTVSFLNSAIVCENSEVTLTSTSVPNAGTITQYIWLVNGSPTGGNNAIVNFTPLVAGNYNISLTIVTDKGCTSETSRTLIIQPTPDVDFEVPNVCLPTGVASFNDGTTISSGSLSTWAWQFGDAGVSSVQHPTHNYTSAGPFNVVLTVTSAAGCVGTRTKPITTIYAEPQAVINSVPEACLGTAVSFTDGSHAPGSSVTQWAWDFGDGNTSLVQNPSHTYAGPGTYTVTLNVTSAIGCATVGNFASHTVVINPLPVADFTTSLPTCMTREVTFTSTAVPNAGNITKWSWDFGNSTSAVYNSAVPFTQIYAGAGIYDVSLFVETNKGCISTVTRKPVEIFVLPSADFTIPEACISDVASQFSGTSTVNPGTVTAWQWNFGDLNANAGNPNTSTLENPTHHFTVAGSYTVTLIAFSNNGCTDTIPKTLFVNGSVPVAGFTIENQDQLCSNTPVVVKDGSSVDIGKLVKVEIFWDYTNDPTIRTVVEDPVVGANYTHSYPEFGTPFTRTVTIRYVAYSGETCLSTFTRTVTLRATPSLVFTAVEPVCEDVPKFQITQAQVANGLPGSFVFTGNGVTAAGIFTPADAGVGVHTITYTFTGDNGCSNTIDQTIEVNPKPGINAGPDKFVLQGGAVELTPALNAGMPVSYLWDPPTALSNPAISNPLASPDDDITYTLTVTSDKGCQNSDAVFVKVLKKPIIPNIFSPNGDGNHDRWEVPYLESYPGCTVDIVNRYGQLVYHSIGYSRPWDGKVNGKDVPIGTYYYVIDPKNGRPKMTGYVDVIR